MTLDPTIVVAVLGLVGTATTGFFAWRGHKATARADQAMAHAEQVRVAVESLTSTVKAQGEELKSERDRREELEDALNEERSSRQVLQEKVAHLETELRVARIYEGVLIAHINAGYGPPPPERPTHV